MIITVLAAVLVVILAAMVWLKQLLGSACVHVLLIFLFRFVLLSGGGYICSDDNSLIRFRLKIAVGILYMSLSAILLFYLFSTVMPLPPWGAVAILGMALVAVELGYAFFFPYSCCCIGEDDEEVNLPA